MEIVRKTMDPTRKKVEIVSKTVPEVCKKMEFICKNLLEIREKTEENVRLKYTAKPPDSLPDKQDIEMLK